MRRSSLPSSPSRFLPEAPVGRVAGDKAVTGDWEMWLAGGTCDGEKGRERGQTDPRAAEGDGTDVNDECLGLQLESRREL